MNSFTNLREAFLVFLTLTVISIINAGQILEGEKISMQYMHMQMTELLELDRNQIEKIHTINLVYQNEASRIIDQKAGYSAEKMSDLLRERNKQIIDVLNEQQRKVLYTYCTDLVSF